MYVFLLVLTSLPSWRFAVENKEENACRHLSFNQQNAAVVLYSDHSSREELESFLKFLVVKKITLTGCNGATLTEEEENRFLAISDDLQSIDQSIDLGEIDKIAKGEKATNGEVGEIPIGEKLEIDNPNEKVADVDSELQVVEEVVKEVSDNAQAAVDDGRVTDSKLDEHKFLTNYGSNMVFTDDEIDAMMLIDQLLGFGTPK